MKPKKLKKPSKSKQEKECEAWHREDGEVIFDDAKQEALDLWGYEKD